jgi:hypothetical protein
MDISEIFIEVTAVFVSDRDITTDTFKEFVDS